MLNEFVFVGGSVTGLLIADVAAASPGPMDVDAITQIAPYAEYVAFGESCESWAFHEDLSDGAPVCR